MNALKKINESLKYTPEWSEKPISWVGHMRFANWLITEFSPKKIVELGTHSGNSYFCFCQAVKQKNIESKCYAIDTWEGDEHSRGYSEDIYNQVLRHNNNNYSQFSQLLRTRFDEALEKFDDGSINLLHIDGLHTYDAVKHDFESWLPKMAPGGIILFHDISVLQDGFGAWKLWNELKISYKNRMEFHHSYGLGVIHLSDNTINSPKYFDSTSEENRLIQESFTILGEKDFEDKKREIKLRKIEGELASIKKSLGYRITKPFLDIWTLISKK
jgi:predicted O-methyltransferase YrrM